MLCRDEKERVDEGHDFCVVFKVERVVVFFFFWENVIFMFGFKNNWPMCYYDS